MIKSDKVGANHVINIKSGAAVIRWKRYCRVEFILSQADLSSAGSMLQFFENSLISQKIRRGQWTRAKSRPKRHLAQILSSADF